AGLDGAVAGKSTNCLPGIQGPEGNERSPSRTRAIKHRPWVAELLSNQQCPDGFSRRYGLPGTDSRSIKCGFGARRVFRCLSYDLPPVEHQSLGFNLSAKVFFAESGS